MDVRNVRKEGPQRYSVRKKEPQSCLPLSNGHHRIGNNTKFVDNFALMKHLGLSWPVLGAAIIASHRK